MDYSIALIGLITVMVLLGRRKQPKSVSVDIVCPIELEWMKRKNEDRKTRHV